MDNENTGRYAWPAAAPGRADGLLCCGHQEKVRPRRRRAFVPGKEVKEVNSRQGQGGPGRRVVSRQQVDRAYAYACAQCRARRGLRSRSVE